LAAQNQGPKLALTAWLVDTGPLVAYVDRRERAHQPVAAVLEPFTGQLITTSAVITESMYFLSEVSGGPLALAELITASSTLIVDLAAPEDLVQAARLMEKYRDTPMDFADATLVIAADRVGVTDILTLDRRGFSTYRTAKRKPFRIVE
jgi:predicted nucleic acid-binding protein